MTAEAKPTPIHFRPKPDDRERIERLRAHYDEQGVQLSDAQIIRAAILSAERAIGPESQAPDIDKLPPLNAAARIIKANPGAVLLWDDGEWAIMTPEQWLLCEGEYLTQDDDPDALLRSLCMVARLRFERA